ncbi:organic solvent tolerance protein OstA [Carboxylicivirga sp. A043]|uniref:OstA-like protein n=1 Tax=Carboxylicivirga litoralis TaxID=2816963 RepID=UPI0021CB291F|nr:OstA-like protein [Carboxylicivirga sp. A043]MCU4156314.1 organic solvent tolerance protein OstA [Carboxylicivirga sp. A043]
MQIKLLSILLLMSIGISSNTYSQKKNIVKILHTDVLYGRPDKGKNVKLLIGNVRLKHQNTLMYCDSAYHYSYKDSSYIEAFNNIHIIQNDSIHLYGDYLTYSGKEGIARVRDNVRIQKKDVTVLTEFLDYDRVNNFGYYFNGGEVLSGQNTLISDFGYYYPNLSEVHFKDSVVVHNPRYTIFSDTLKYHTVTEVASILGPTFIHSDNNLIYSENGAYDTMNDKAQLFKGETQSYVQGKENLLKGDTIYYNRREGLGEAYQNFELHDTTNNMIIAGDYGFYNELSQYALATKKAQLLQIYQNDTLYLHADTLQAIPLPEEQSRLVKAYYNVKFFRKDMQGRCDSMVYDMRDSTNTFYNTPVIWAQGNQMTAQTIKLYSRNNALYKAELNNSAFIVAPEDSLSFNQIKGRNMIGYIKNNQLYRIDVDGNGQTIYYPKDKEVVIGVNRAESSSLSIFLKDRKITGITLKTEPNGNLNPPYFLPDEDVKLKGFVWLESIRPKNRWDIFKHVEMPKLKALEDNFDDYQFGDTNN